ASLGRKAAAAPIICRTAAARRAPARPADRTSPSRAAARLMKTKTRTKAGSPARPAASAAAVRAAQAAPAAAGPSKTLSVQQTAPRSLEGSAALLLYAGCAESCAASRSIHGAKLGRERIEPTHA